MKFPKVPPGFLKAGVYFACSVLRTRTLAIGGLYVSIV